MQQPPPVILRQRLIDAVDDKYHVIDMAAIVEVLGTLESLPVTKEVLESTRLGRTVNEFRRRVDNEHLAKRAKDLVKKWRDQVLPEQPHQPHIPTFVGRPINGNAFLVSEGPGPGPGGTAYTSITTISSVNGKAIHPLIAPLPEVSERQPGPSDHSFSHGTPPTVSSLSVNGSVVQIWDGPGSFSFTPVSSKTPPMTSGSFGGSLGSSSLASTSQNLATASIVTSTSLGSPDSNELISMPQKSRGRKRKRKAVTMEDKLADVTSLLKGQFAKANELRSGIPRVPPTTASLLDEQRSSSSPDGGYSLQTTLSADDQLIKNDLVEKYLKSQSELKSQMERQYQDRLARNEFQDSVSVTEEDAETNSSVNSLAAGDVTDAASAVSSASTKNRPQLSVRKGVKSSARKKKQELKAATQGEAGNNQQTDIRFESEAEILSKLPPIDPELLVEFANFVCDSSDPVVEIPPAPTNANLTKHETERLTDSTGNSGNLNTSTSLENRNKMFDFGDSDEEDDDLVEVQLPQDTSLRLGETEASSTTTNTTEKTVEFPYREVDESEVTRLHEEKIENLNGNFDKAGTFREWHETLVVKSYGGEDFLILPYSVNDF